jgi:hypothetical protein
MQDYEDLKTMVAEIEDDLNKAESGNKAAGTRVRKQMQQIKKVANAVRSKILELRSSIRTSSIKPDQGSNHASDVDN